jgi:hypothetical protein
MTPQIVQEPLPMTNPTTPTDPDRSALSARQAARERMLDAAGTRSPDTLPHSCRCGTRWAGSNTAHCGACHDTFSGVSTFDRHRRDGRCIAPYHVGLSLLDGRAYDCWGDVQASVVGTGPGGAQGRTGGAE